MNRLVPASEVTVPLIVMLPPCPPAPVPSPAPPEVDSVPNSPDLNVVSSAAVMVMEPPSPPLALLPPAASPPVVLMLFARVMAPNIAVRLMAPPGPLAFEESSAPVRLMPPGFETVSVMAPPWVVMLPLPVMPTAVTAGSGVGDGPWIPGDQRDRTAAGGDVGVEDDALPRLEPIGKGVAGVDSCVEGDVLIGLHRDIGVGVIDSAGGDGEIRARRVAEHIHVGQRGRPARGDGDIAR